MLPPFSPRLGLLLSLGLVTLACERELDTSNPTTNYAVGSAHCGGGFTQTRQGGPAAPTHMNCDDRSQAAPTLHFFKGRVVARDEGTFGGAPLSGMQVSLARIDGAQPKPMPKATTDAQGNFRLSDPRNRGLCELEIWDPNSGQLVHNHSLQCERLRQHAERALEIAVPSAAMPQPAAE